jgi:hypothetical protein
MIDKGYLAPGQSEVRNGSTINRFTQKRTVNGKRESVLVMPLDVLHQDDDQDD